MSQKQEYSNATESTRSKEIKHSLVKGSIPLIISAICFLILDKPHIGRATLTLGSVMILSGIFVPPLYRGIIKTIDFLVKIVGISLTWLLLVPFFYICFLPGRIILLLLNKDPLMRKFPTTNKSYWLDCKKDIDVEQYKKQF